MKEKYLIVNAGSSSLKFQLYEMPEEKVLINGYIEKIGMPDCFWTIKINGEKIKKQKSLQNHTEAVEVLIEELINNKVVESMDEIKGVGHRVLHGGEKYSDSVLITEEVIEDIKNLTKLGPLHHPGNLAGINAMKEALPNVPMVAVFDTAFHQTIPDYNYIYPVPYEWYEKYGVRKYGFHGTSHKYITGAMQEKLGKKDVNLIICHIGSGSSISAIKDGKCYDTTMGITPLDGLMMGTRSGSIDPSIIEYVCKESGKDVSEVTNDLNKKSGILGISGVSDYRDLLNLMEKNDKKAKLAFDMLKKSVEKYIVQYYFELDCKLDALIFTAGIGENGILLREKIVDDISLFINVRLNRSMNNEINISKKYTEGVISTSDSMFDILVLPTNEESIILKDTYNIVNKKLENSKVLKRI